MKKQKLCIFAGGGEFPELAIQKAFEKNFDVYVVGFTNFFDKSVLKKFPSVKFYDFHIGHIKKYLKVLKKEKIKKVFFIGKLYKHIIFKERKFDLLAVKLLLSLKDKSDYSILSKFVELFKNEGISVISQKYLFSDFLCPSGFVTKLKLKKKDIEIAEWGYSIGKSVANLDIGQSLIINNKTVISVEGIEGTDNMIRRSKKFIFEKNNAFFIKVARKKYDPRFDLPTVGITTVKELFKIGVKNIVLESNVVLMPQYEKIIEFANKNKMCILGI